MKRLEDATLKNAIAAYETTMKVCEEGDCIEHITALDKVTVAFLKELQEYRALEEQGLLLKLPCKVGDAVWDIAGKEIREQIVDGIEYRTDGFYIYANEDEWLGKLSELVFLTKFEAEKALAEMGCE